MNEMLKNLAAAVVVASSIILGSAQTVAASTLAPKVVANAVQCVGNKFEVFRPQIFATDTVYAGSNGKFQFIQYVSIVQKWDGSAWKDANSQYSAGSTDTYGHTMITALSDTYQIDAPGYYRAQYFVQWWNGYVDSLGIKRDVTKVIAASRFDLPTSSYRYLSADFINLTRDPLLDGAAAGTPWCRFN